MMVGMWWYWFIVDCFRVVVVVLVSLNGCWWFVEWLWLYGLGWLIVNGYMYIWVFDVFGYELLFLVVWFVDSFCFGFGCVVGSGWVFVVKMVCISLMLMVFEVMWVVYIYVIGCVWWFVGLIFNYFVNKCCLWLFVYEI